MISFSDIAAKILEEDAPAAVRNKRLPITKIAYRMNAAAYAFEELVNSKRLHLPKEKTPLCFWEVIN